MAEEKEKSAGEEGQDFTLISWNINGMRTISMSQTLNQLHPSVLAVQETKLSRNQLDESQALIDSYSSFFSYSKNRGGYSGVATYCHSAWTPIRAEEGLSGLILDPKYKASDQAIGSYCSVREEDIPNARYGDMDGRAILTQFLVNTPEGEEKRLNVINVYCPRLRDDPADQINNKDFKLNFHHLLADRAKNLVNEGEFVVILGDLNVSHKILDQSDVDPIQQFRQTEFRDWMNDLLSSAHEHGFEDTFRALHPTREKAFTCWCQKLNARQNNYGARIDYILADKKLMKYLKTAIIHPDIMGSDHCPVSASFHSLTPVQNDKLPSCATKFYPEFSGKQQTLKDLFQKCEPAQSVSSSPKPESPSNSQGKKREKRPAESATKGPKQTSLTNFFVKKTKLDNEKQNCSSSDSKSTDWQQNDGNEPSGFFKEVNFGASSAWKQLLKAPETPTCSGHSEACVLRTVRKKGPHQGRQFWACSKGSGLANDPNASCNFFKWVNTKT